MAALGLSLALVAAFLYTAATFFFKNALLRGASANQVNLAANLGVVLLTQPFWFLDRPDLPNAPLWQPLLCSVTFFLGQLFTFTALRRGDVSVATPLLATKILFVTAFNALLFGMDISVRYWVATLIATGALVLVTGGAPRGQARAIGFTALFSLLSALFFSLTDVFVQRWAGAFDTMPFIPVLYGGAGLLSVVYYLMTDRRAFFISRKVWPPLSVGVCLLSVQLLMIFLSIVWSKDATAVNVLYASRCIWSVVAAWTAGQLFGLKDREAGTRVMLRRLAGAVLLFGAIILILF